jgi:hypothetical protein
VSARSGRLVLAAIGLLVVGGACSEGGDAGAGRLSVDGRVELASAGGKSQEERGSRSLEFGDRVKVLEGMATVRLGDDRELELRTGSNVVLEEVQDGKQRVAQPRLLEADLLVQAPPGARLTVSTEGTDVIVSGGAQVSRGPALVVSSYDGAVELRSGDRTTTVPALRQVSVPAGGALPDRPSALSYDAGDAWDRRFLSDAIELGNQLEARSKGFSAQVRPTDGRTIESLLTLLPSLADHPEFGLTLFDALRPPGESLVGAAIVLEGRRGTFAERWAGVFGFRDDGAQWGLVALDQGVDRAPLLAAIDGAIGRGPRPFEPVPLPTVPSEGGLALPIPPGTGPGGSTNPSGSTPPGSTPSSPVPTTAPLPTVPGSDIGPLNTGIPILDNTINALVEALSGLLESLGHS